MTYSIVGILAALILLISNRDILWNTGKEITETSKNYRWFIMAILLYLITDISWGILEANRLTLILYIDTTVHFIAMALAVLMWTRYVVLYLGNSDFFGKFLLYAGRVFFAFQVAAVTANLFTPVMFWFDDEGMYHAGSARYVALALQIILFLMTSVYTLSVTSKTEGSVKHRHLTIGLFGIAMTMFIAIQVFYPLLPLYAMGYMLGTCLMHSFVVEDEKEEYRRGLEEALQREHRQTVELNESREALRDALAETEFANKAKTDFLSNMSHEIRTPMNAIIGLNNILMNDPETSDHIREQLGKIDSAAQHLLEIINDILDMSRIEAGRVIVSKEPFSLAESLEQVNTIISGQCNDKGIEYECRTEGKIDDYYVGDAMKLRQVLINLLSNAVKFTDDGGKISFITEEGPRYNGKAVIRFIISDTGIGMSEDYLTKLFDPFSQENSAITNKLGSTGLGMSITKSFIELMNGNIDVKSEKDKGTVFTVTLTLEESEMTDAPDVKDDAADGHEDRETPSLEGHRILLAEDMPVNAEIMMMLLSSWGIEADLAEDGRIAVDKFAGHEEGHYDAVLMDMRMPVMDGLEAAKTIRAMERKDAKSIPMIALTANAFDNDVQRSMQAGLNAHLSKPVKPDELFDTLGKLIRADSTEI